MHLTVRWANFKRLTNVLNYLINTLRHSMIFNKKYFLEIFAVFGIQLGLGVNSAIAVPCEAEFNAVIEIFKEASRKNNFTYQGANVPYNFVTDIVFTSPNDFWPNLKKKMSDPYYGVNNNTFAENVDHFRHLNKMARDRAKNGSYEPTILEVCYTQAMVDANGDIDSIINGKTANKSSSSGSSSKSNKKANRQSAQNQPSSSSNSSDQSTKKLNDAIDQFNSADKQKDYAKAIPALKIIVANTQDKQLKAAATSRLGEYYKFGDGVQKDEVKAQALFEQASIDGSTDADAQICHNYLNGIGVTENHQTAIKYCTKAANSGDLIPMAQLGWIYAAGTGTQNEQLAKEWTCKAAQKGHAGSIKNAQKLNFNCN